MKKRHKRESPRYTEWCRQVFERDGHKCAVCGKRGWINAHHLNGWNWAVAQRYKIDNGVTLCAGKNGCHEKFHKKYGRGDNTKAQFLQFARIQRGKTNGQESFKRKKKRRK